MGFMDWLFLEAITLDLSDVGSEAVAGILAAIFSVLLGMFFVAFFFIIGIYVYSSFAYMEIGKKAKHKNPGIAWIPIVGKPLLTSQIAKMPWWPVLFLAGFIFAWIPFVGIFITYGSSVAFTVFFFIWRWKTYEKVGHPGWFSLFFLVPVVGYVFLGIVAWSKENIIEPIKKKRK